MPGPDTLKKQAWICTFYSFKGGLGRTLAASNCARHLSEGMGYRVGVVDLDLEAPGMASEPLCDFMDKRWIDTPARYSASIDLMRTIDGCQGFIGAYCDERDGTQEPMNNYVVPLPVIGNGALFFMPPARGSASLKDYGQDLRSIHATFGTRAAPASGNTSGDTGQPDRISRYTASVLRRFIDHFMLDFVIVDARTGFGEFFQASTASIPHALFLFVGFNQQNLAGVEQVINQRLADDLPEAPAFLSLSPIPSGGAERLENAIFRVRKKLKQLRHDRDDRLNYAYSVPEDIDFWLTYSDTAAFSEEYFIGRFPNSNLAKQYRRITNKIASLRAASDVPYGGIPEARLTRPTSKTTIRFAGESTLLPRFLELFGTPGSRTELDQREEIVFELDNKRLEATFYETGQAPWDRQSTIKEFDLVALPIRAVHSFDHQLFTLRDLRTHYAEKIPCFDTRYLDVAFPGWRQWCGGTRAMLGLPFTISTPLYCVDRDKFRELRQHYFSLKYGRLPVASRDTKDYDFFPSSWELLSEILAMKKLEVAVSAKPVDIYNEWAAIVNASGGTILDVFEGQVSGDFHLTDSRVIDGSIRYFDLVRCSGGYPYDYRSMRDNLTAFRKSDLDINLCFSDGLVFRKISRTRKEKDKAIESTGIISNEPQASGSELTGKHSRVIIVVRLPSDVRYSSRALVDGTSLVFPKNATDSTRTTQLDQAAEFANNLLNKSCDPEVVKTGFPCVSRPVLEKLVDETEAVQRELRNRAHMPGTPTRLSLQHLNNFQVFLQSQLRAIDDGCLSLPDFCTDYHTESSRDFVGTRIQKMYGKDRKFASDEIDARREHVRESLRKLQAELEERFSDQILDR